MQADESHKVAGNRSTQVLGRQYETIKLESRVVVEEGNYSVSVHQGVLTLKAATSIVLEVGAG